MATTNIQTFSGDVDVVSNLTVDTTTLHVDSVSSRVGIGKTNPAYTLDVTGDINFTGTLYDSGTQQVSSQWVTTGSDVYYTTGNVGVGVAAPTSKLHVGGDIYASGDVTAYSDKRGKTDITYIENALDKINKIGGYTYRKVDEESKKKHMGVMAQEVLTVFPEVILGSEEEGYRVAYGNMAGAFIEAFKEITNEIKKIKEHLNIN